jgi:maltooligosyltrehalose synthase
MAPHAIISTVMTATPEVVAVLTADLVSKRRSRRRPGRQWHPVCSQSPPLMHPATLPTATYRLQFNAGFTFEDATGLVDYLGALGISHCYASNYLKAVPGSTHGYDVADPTQLNPEIGDERAYASWVATLRTHGMGHIIDLVPNHMGIARSANPWWQDVLENGESSRFAAVFDIDWQPLKTELETQGAAAVLGDTYGAVLERQEIRLEYDQGSFGPATSTSGSRLRLAPTTRYSVVNQNACSGRSAARASTARSSSAS